jgi:hypothetical protein
MGFKLFGLIHQLGLLVVVLVLVIPQMVQLAVRGEPLLKQTVLPILVLVLVVELVLFEVVVLALSFCGIQTLTQLLQLDLPLLQQQ